jgi:hypothetical protein
MNGTVGSPFEAASALPDYRFRIEFWAILGCVILFLALIELVRRHQLKERYSFLWFLTSGVLLAFTLRRDWLEDLARLVGVYYPPTALFLLLVFFLILILIHFSTVISRLLDSNQTLAQSVAILEARIKKMETRESAPVSGNASSALAEPPEST